MQSPTSIAAKRGKKVEESDPWLSRTSTGGTVKVRLVKGLRGCRRSHRLSVKALGLNKLNDVRELKDSPQVRGLINKVALPRSSVEE